MIPFLFQLTRNKRKSERERGREGGREREREREEGKEEIRWKPNFHDVENDRHDIHVSARVQLAFLTFRLMYTFGTNRYHGLLPSRVPTVT